MASPSRRAFGLDGDPIRLAHYYHLAAMHFWCIVFEAIWSVGLDSAYFWALDKASGHSCWLQIEDEER
jgi:hypothetical protein